jgi:nucleoside-diphosphate-sugar epimerase
MKPDSGKPRVLLTGAAGHLGQVVLAHLAGDLGFEVTALDRRAAPDARSAALAAAWWRVDLAEAGLRPALTGFDALVHLAGGVLVKRRNAIEAARTNLQASRELLRDAAGAGLPRIVHVSTAAVYGGGLALREDAPLRPLAAFPYARQKALLDAWVQRHLPGICTLRPTIVLGPGSQELLRRLARRGLPLHLPEPQPPWQVVHETDVAQAVGAALQRPVQGPFNLAASGSLCLRDLGPTARWLKFKPASALSVARLAWRAGLLGAEPGWLAGAQHPLTLDCGRAHRELGWLPLHADARAVLAST